MCHVLPPRAAAQVPSPNCDARPEGVAITLLVVHNISLPPGKFGGNAIVELFTNRLNPAAHPYYATIAKLRVSAHFLIRRNGALIQFVPCALRAWHAGVAFWGGEEDINSCSIGVEIGLVADHALIGFDRENAFVRSVAEQHAGSIAVAVSWLQSLKRLVSPMPRTVRFNQDLFCDSSGMEGEFTVESSQFT